MGWDTGWAPRPRATSPLPPPSCRTPKHEAEPLPGHVLHLPPGSQKHNPGASQPVPTTWPRRPTAPTATARAQPGHCPHPLLLTPRPSPLAPRPSPHVGVAVPGAPRTARTAADAGLPGQRLMTSRDAGELCSRCSGCHRCCQGNGGAGDIPQVPEGDRGVPLHKAPRHQRIPQCPDRGFAPPPSIPGLGSEVPGTPRDFPRCPKLPQL